LRCILFSFLLRKTKSKPIRLLADKYLGRELSSIPRFLHVEYLELDLFIIALSPLDDAALVIGIRLDHQVQVEVGLDQFIDHEFLTSQVALVEINGTDQRFERVAQDDLL
jgi:hypothetical protein